MFTRANFFVVAILVALSLSCTDKQETQQQPAAEKQPASDDSTKISAADTIFADTYFTKAEQFAKEEKYDSAIVYFEKASVLYETEEDWEKYVRSYNRMGKQSWRKGSYEQAMEYLNQAVEMGLNKLDAQHSEIADSYYNMGIVYDIRGESDQALAFHDKALSIMRATLGEQHSDVAYSYNNLGLAYMRKGDYDRALVFYNKALSIRLTTLGKLHPEVAQSYNNIGLIYANKGNYDQALAFYDKSYQSN